MNPRLTRRIFTLAASAVVGCSYVCAALNSPARADVDGGMAGAKGLFFQQLDKPGENLNTGLRYWIELKRGNSVTRVTNKTQFHTNDSIRFHVRSNIDGYAYILLSSGSRGEQSVLFPDPKINESNKVTHGKEYVMPGDGYLTFDENPGVEKLTLLLSREPMDAQAYLSKPRQEVTMIASAETGSKDLVPTKIYVAYNPPKPEVQLIASQPAPTTPVRRNESKTDVKPVEHKAGRTEKSDGKDDSKSEAKNESKNVSKGKGHSHKVVSTHRTPVAIRSSSAPAATSSDDEGTTTVVSEESSGILHVDVALQHI